MPLYRTRYLLPTGSPRTTQCYATDPTHLEEVIRLRGMDETRSDPSDTSEFREPQMASELWLAGKFAAANHALIWTGMIAVRAGLADGWALLCDSGIIHDMAHALHTREVFGTVFDKESLADRIEAFERLVPGVHPCWAGDDRRIVMDYTARMREVAARAEARRQHEAQSYAYSGRLYPYQRDAIAAIMKGSEKRPSLYKDSEKGQSLYGSSYNFDSVRDSYIKLKQSFDALRDWSVIRLDEPAYTAPRAKVGSRAFADHQRQQGQAEKNRKKADLVAKMKANLGPKEPTQQKSMLRAVTETTYGQVPSSKEAARLRGSRPHTIIMDDPIVKLDGQPLGKIESIVIGFDPAGPDMDRSVVTGRTAHVLPVSYEAGSEGTFLRVNGDRIADPEQGTGLATIDFSDVEVRILSNIDRKELLDG